MHIYSIAQRRRAIALAKKVGPSAAAAKLGLPAGTVTCWTFKARQAEQAGEEWPTRTGSKTKQRRRARRVSKRRRELPVKKTTTNGGSSAKNVARVYTPSEKARALELATEVGVAAASKKLGISRFSIYDWRRKVKRAADGKGDSPTSGSDPADIEAKRDNEILGMWREHPGLGPSQIRNQLRRSGIKVSTHTVRRVMEDAGYRLPKVKRQEHTKRFEAVRPNHMWHLDFVHRFIGRASVFILIIIDDCSRFVVGHGVDDAERADMVLSTFEKATERHGKPEMVLHDKGSAFWSWKGIARFTRLLEEMGVDQIAAPYKEWNGKLEVFNGNLQKELFDAHKFYDVAEMKRRLAAHLHWYNQRRTSHALGGLLVPADRYFGRMDEVLARIEAGVAIESNDVLSLRDRVLELFKVTSTNGQAEVWLMGQKLFALSQ